tara:strand:+ start:1454 stop:1828 length:375 start_codon:yes stop_codon:yes gene_type:complete
MKEDYNSYSLRGLEDAVEDALQSDCTPEDIIDCFLSTIKKNLNYHKVCARHSKEVLDLFYKIDRSTKVVNLNADMVTNKANWVDYTELPDKFQYDLTEDELIEKGFKMKSEDGTVVWTKNTTQN